eukprot:1543148-Rhodomonas_salina.1
MVHWHTGLQATNFTKHTLCNRNCTLASYGYQGWYCPTGYFISVTLLPPVKLLLCVYSVPVGRPWPWASAVKCLLVALRPVPGALVAGVCGSVLGAAACALSLDAGALAGMGRWVSVGFFVLVCRVAGAAGALAGSGGIQSLVLVGFLVLVCWSVIAAGALAGRGGGPSVAPVGFFVL